MNPEFRRQLWLQFSLTRVGTLVLLLAACFTAVYLSSSGFAVAMASTGATLFGILVLGVGTVAAGASVMDEIADRTWDQQRMSAMQPWAMTWGKLAGASSYSWFGGALCLLVALPYALAWAPWSYVVRVALLAILAGVFFQASLLAVNLQFAKSGRRIPARGGIMFVLLLGLVGTGPLVNGLSGEDIFWWGHALARLDFALASVALFTSCALVAAWRSMAEVLAVRQLPWGWPAMALVVAAYVTGFAWAGPQQLTATQMLTSFCLISSIALTYLALLSEPQSRPQWSRLLHRVQQQQWRAALQQLPRWSTTGLLSIVCAVAVTLVRERMWVLPWEATQWGWASPLTLVLLLMRDCALALYFAFSLKIRRPNMAFMLLMLVLYGLLPWLVGVAGGPDLVLVVLPLAASSSVASLVAFVHLLIAASLLYRRWLHSAT